MIVSTEVEWDTTRGLSIGAVTFDFEVEVRLKAGTKCDKSIGTGQKNGAWVGKAKKAH